MKYYNSKGQKVDVNLDRYRHFGGCSSIYMLDDEIAFKKYYSYTTARIKEEVFNILKSINNPHLIKLLEYYYSSYPFTLDNQKLSDLVVDAYTYEYVKEDKINILEDNIEFTLYNLEKIENLFILLTLLNIWIKDVKRANVVYRGNELVIIDPDLFSFNSLAREELIKHNREELRNLFISLYLHSFQYKYEKYKYAIVDLFKTDSKYLVDGVAKKLSGYKRPIDYLNR